MSGKYTLLLLGSGGREHALAWKLSRSPLLNQLFIAPGNAGTSHVGENVTLSENDFPGIREFVIRNNVNMVVVGPEAPLVNGIQDYFSNDPDLKSVLLIGPSATGASLEGSKDFAKAFMKRWNIPTAAYQTFTQSGFEEAKIFLKSLKAPYVLKADGLAAGKGVVICSDYTQACAELEEMLLNTRFGKASEKVVIEEFLEGIEMSAFILTDGNAYALLPEAKDYKRIGDGDTGPNTGGMGCVSPVPFFDASFREKVLKQVIQPTIQGLRSEGIPYTGFIFFGLMNVKGEPFVIEYNCRLGDPETEVILPRIDTDFLSLLESAALGTLENQTVPVTENTTLAVMLVSQGYPGDYPKGKRIDYSPDELNGLLFHAGTKANPETNTIHTNGGRVMAVVGQAKTIAEARTEAYQSIQEIAFDGMNFRTDIGLDLIHLSQ